jgi:hypothetical protein
LIVCLFECLFVCLFVCLFEHLFDSTVSMELSFVMNSNISMDFVFVRTFPWNCHE